jgi:probable F420-dependent oxidoreductase
MEFGLGLPTAGRGSSLDRIVEVADGAERLGLAAVWTFERLLRPTQPVTIGDRPPFVLPEYYAVAWDPLETLAFVAARTSRVRLGTSVIPSLLHPPVVLARRFATLDRLSGGRVIAGLGQGWMPDEFAVAEVPITRRGAGFDEHLAAMRAVWSDDPVRFDGRFYRIPESEIGPKPTQPGGPPVLVGATTPAGVERTARLGLGLNPVLMGWEQLEDMVQAFRTAAAGAGHDPLALPVVVRVNGTVTDTPVEDRAPGTGSVEQVADDVARLDALGISQTFWSMATAPAKQLEAMERLLDLAATHP